jgi:hypothetical protein
MKKHPNVGSKVETVFKNKYTFTLSEYEKFLNASGKTEKFTSNTLTQSYLKRILRRNRTVFKNWIPAPCNDLDVLEAKMNSLIWFLFEKVNRENVITLLKSKIPVNVNYDKYHQVTTIDTESVLYADLPSDAKKEINESITTFPDPPEVLIIDTKEIDSDIEKCREFISKNEDWRLKIVDNMHNKHKEVALETSPESVVDFGNNFWGKVDNELSTMQPEEKTKFHVQTTTYWLFWFIPIWITREIVTLSNPK